MELQQFKPHDALECVINDSAGILELKGRSILEDSDGFYQQVINWAKKHGQEGKGNLTVNMFLEYFNTQSQKGIYTFFRTLEDLHKTNDTRVKVNWHFETDDDEMMYQGEEFKKIFQMPVDVVEIEDFGYQYN